MLSTRTGNARPYRRDPDHGREKAEELMFQVPFRAGEASKTR